MAAELPDDPEMLKAMLVALRIENETLKAVNADAEARMARLTALLKALGRARLMAGAPKRSTRTSTPSPSRRP